MKTSSVIDGTLALDPWHKQYIKHLMPEEKAAIAWSDIEAISKYPKHAWIYDKYMLCTALGQDVWLDVHVSHTNDIPKNIFVKPRVNLCGMGLEASEIKKDEIEIGDFIVQPVYRGTQYTVDIMLKKGHVLDYFGFIGHKNNKGSFIYFESIQKKLIPQCVFKAAKLLPKFTGIINVECINENIIEMHLRPSMDFYDISGNIIKKTIDMITKSWSLDPVFYEKTYCMVFRLTTDCRPQPKTDIDKIIKFAHSDIRSVQLCWEEDYWLGYYDQDETSYVLTRVNGLSRGACISLANKIFANLKLRKR